MARANKKAPKPRQRLGRRSAPQKKPLPWKQIAGWGSAIAVVAVLGFFLVQNANRSSEEDPEILAQAEANAGTAIEVHTGTNHTVYHSVPDLPTSTRPQAQGKPTLVWFSGTWCEFCEQMDPFAHTTAGAFVGDLFFVEKSVDHDRSAANRYGVRGTPTFVLIDPEGSEIERFGFQRTASAFQATIQSVLDRYTQANT